MSTSSGYSTVRLMNATTASLMLSVTARGAIDNGFENGGAQLNLWFLLLHAEFLFAVQIVLYVGGIMVLFLFVIMLMNLNQDTEPQKTAVSKMIAGVLGGLLLIVLVGALRGTEELEIVRVGHSPVGLVRNLGRVLFREFLFPFEIVSVLLLSALVGAIMIGKKETN